MLYLVYDYSTDQYYNMELNDNQIDFIENAIPCFLYVYSNMECINPEDQKNSKLFIIENEFTGANFIYLNDNNKKLFNKLDYKIQLYDQIKTINFYEWAKTNLNEMRICLNNEDYENKNYQEIFEKIL